MKICIPVKEDKGLKSLVYGHFGSAPCFVIYDTDKKDTQAVINSNQHHSHGTCHPLSVLSGQKIDAVLCAGMGAGAVKSLNESGIRAFRVEEGDIETLAKKYEEGNMDEITIENSCARHGCH